MQVSWAVFLASAGVSPEYAAAASWEQGSAVLGWEALAGTMGVVALLCPSVSNPPVD